MQGPLRSLVEFQLGERVTPCTLDYWAIEIDGTVVNRIWQMQLKQTALLTEIPKEIASTIVA